MLKFNKGTWSGPQTITKVELLQGSTVKYTATEVRGSVYADENGIGEYVKISIEDTGNGTYTVNNIKIYNGSTELAALDTTNSAFSVTKAEGKGIKLELSCQFEGASNCSFDTTVATPLHATKFREGVVRLANGTDESQKANTVYSAADVESYVSSTIGNSNQYVPWDISNDEPVTGETTVSQIKVQTAYGTSTNEATITNSGGKLSINKTLTGDVVASTTTFSSHTISGASSSEKVVNEKYIDSIYSNAVIVSSSATDKLVSGYAVDTLVNGTGNDFVHKAGAETITGAKTFSADAAFNGNVTVGTGKKISTPTIESASYGGTGVYSSYVAGDGTGGWAASGSASKIPTVGTVKSAIDDGDSAVTTAFQTADSGLQAQIDAINAGQNLADIINTRTTGTDDLASLNAENLLGGDKVQVLHDKTKSDGTIDTTTGYNGVSTVYSLEQGTAAANTRDVIASGKSGYYWHYIGEYGCDAYTKSQADSNFVAKDHIATSTTLSSHSTADDYVPSVKAMYSAISTAGGDYVKLTSATEQTISSDITISGKLDADGIILLTDSGDSQIGTVTSGKSNFLIANGTDGVSFNVSFNQYFSSDSNGGGYFIFSKTTSNDINDASFALLLKEKGASTLENKTAIAIAPDFTGSGASRVFKQFNVSGEAIADYNDISNASLDDGRLTTVDYVSGTVGSALASLHSATQVGAIGLFMLVATGTAADDAEKAIGATVDGTYLYPVGMTLSNSGQISYKKSSTPAASSAGTEWTLMSLAMKRTATEPCLVLAMRTA